MINALKTAWHYFGTNLTLVTACALLLSVAAANSRLESNSAIEHWFATDTEQIVQIQFAAPQWTEHGQGENRCVRLAMRGMVADETMGAPKLLRRPFAVGKPEGLNFEKFEVTDFVSHQERLPFPLCRNQSYEVKESFIDPEKRANELTVVPAERVQATQFPYPASPVTHRSGVGTAANAQRFLAYPVVAKDLLLVEVFTQITLKIDYVDQNAQQRFASKLAPQLRFSIPTGEAIRSLVSTPGAYEVSGAVLNNIPSGTAPSQVQVWLDGSQIPREVVQSGAQVSAIRFFIPSVVSTYYANHSAVWIRWNGGAGIDFASEDGDPALQSAGTSVYQQTDDFRAYLRSWNSLPIEEGLSDDGDPIPPPPDRGYAYWELKFAPPGGAGTRNYTFTPKSRLVAGIVKIVPRLRGISYYDTAPDHYLTFALNGTPIGDASFDDQAYVEPELTLATTLLNGVNTFTVNTPGGLVPTKYESHAFYGYRVTYPREMAAVSNVLDFNVDTIGSYTIKDFTSSQIRLFRYEASGITELTEVTIDDQGDGTYHANFSANEVGRYFAIANSQFAAPVESLLDTPSDLQRINSGFDYLLLTSSDLKSTAETLATYRAEASDLSVLTIDVQDIFDEFNYGVADPAAIRTFLKDAVDRWSTPPRFLFIVGDSTADPLGLLNASYRTNTKVPHFFDITFYLGGIPNDSRYAYFTTGSEVPHLAIGRLPARTTTEVEDYLAKLQGYEASDESADWLDRIQLLNDNYNEPLETWEDPFVTTMEWMLQNTPSSYLIDHIDMINVAAVDAKQRLWDNWNAGLLYIYFMGHSTTKMWTAENMIDSLTATNLADPSPGLPFVASMTCLTGNFVATTDVSLSETLIALPRRGAIGVLASSGLTVPDAQAQLEEAFFAKLTNVYGEMGTLLKQTREELDTIGFDRDVARSYNLFGDPALRLKFKTSPVASGGSGDDDAAAGNTGSENITFKHSDGVFGCGAVTVSPAHSSPVFALLMIWTLVILAFWWTRRHLTKRFF